MSVKQPRWIETTLDNGLTFLYRQAAGVPLTAATLLLRTGSRDEKPEQAGLANLTLEMMLQGTRGQTSLQLARRIESVGASLGAQAGEDYSELGFVAPAEHVGRLLEILADILVEPAFPAQELKKERASVLASLQSRKDSLFNVAYDAMNAQLFAGHPYGRPIDGDPAQVKRFTRESLQAWHRHHIHSDRAVLAIISSLPVGAIQRQVQRALKPWTRSSESAQPGPLPAALKGTRTIPVRAHFEQAYLMMGTHAPTALDTDYVPLKVLNTIVGGGMSSRLFMRLREELGLAYEVSSFYPTHMQTSQWIVYLGLPPEKRAVGLRELRKAMQALVRRPPSRVEVQQAVAMMKGSYLMEHQTRRRQAWYAAWWKFIGQSPDHDRVFIETLDRVTPAQLHRLARKLLDQPWITVEVTPR
jgi:zinc protease